jgi:hypothetical protein
MDSYVEQQQKINMKLAEVAPAHGMSEFMQTMTAIMKQNQDILIAITAKNLGVEKTEDNLEPLPPVVEGSKGAERRI